MADLGERVVVCQPERHADPIAVVLLRERRCGDLRRLLDGDGRAVVEFEILLAEPHRLQFHAVPFAPLLVDRVHPPEGRPVPGNQVGRLPFGLFDFLDRPGPAAQRDVGEVGVTNAVLDTHLVPDLETRDDRSALVLGHRSLPGGIVRPIVGNVREPDSAKHHPLGSCRASCSHFRFHALTYSTLNVDGRSASSGIPNQSGIVSLSKIRLSGWCQCVFSTRRTATPST